MLPANSSVMNQLPEGDARARVRAPWQAEARIAHRTIKEPSGESPLCAEGKRQG